MFIDVRCNVKLHAAGAATPRTCVECGNGPCKQIRVQGEEEFPTPIQQSPNSKEEAAWSILGLAAEVVVGILDS